MLELLMLDEGPISVAGATRGAADALLVERQSCASGELDARLAGRAALGDDAAFEAIVRRYRPRLTRYAARIVGSAGAEDAVQHAFINAWRALGDGCEVRELRAWLYSITHRAALQALRTNKESTAELPATLAGDCSPAEHVEAAGRAQAMLSAIADLPRAERDALVWTSVQGRSGRDTARALGVSEGAVRQLVFRARSLVRAAALTVFPVVPLTRLMARAHRAASGLFGGGSSAGTASATLGKLAAAAAIGAAVATPVVAIDMAHHARHEHRAGHIEQAAATSLSVARPHARAGARHLGTGTARGGRAAPDLAPALRTEASTSPPPADASGGPHTTATAPAVGAQAGVERDPAQASVPAAAPALRSAGRVLGGVLEGKRAGVERVVPVVPRVLNGTGELVSGVGAVAQSGVQSVDGVLEGTGQQFNGPLNGLVGGHPTASTGGSPTQP